MMKARTALVGTALTLLAAPGLATVRPLADLGSMNLGNERGALRALEDPFLQSQRAGAVVTRASVGEAERAELRTAEAASTELAAMRAGDLDLSDRDITLIAIVVGVLLILIIIA